MEKDLADKIITTPKQAKSLMSYVGYFITAGIIGIVATLLLLEVIVK